MLQTESLSYVVLLIFAFHMALFGVGGLVLLTRRKEQHDYSRLWIGMFYACLSFACLVFISTALLRSEPTRFLHTILEPYPIIVSFIFTIFLFGYLLEVIRPHWITWKKVILVLIPWMLTCLAFLIYHGYHGWQYESITYIDDWQHIGSNINHPDVIIRLIMVGIYFPYFISLYFIPYNWRTSNITRTRLEILKWMVALIVVGGTLGMLLKIHWAMMVYLVILDLSLVYIFYVEFWERIPVPQTNVDIPATQVVEVPPAKALSPLAQQLQAMLMNQSIWQNPDLQRSDVCQLLGTNYTYLSHAVQELGYTNFSDMINHYRVAFIREELMQHPNTGIGDLFFRAGYRNRTTAIRCFTAKYGCSPSEYRGGVNSSYFTR